MIILAIGIAAAGFFIGEGLKNFKNPTSKKMFQHLDEGNNQTLIKEDIVHNFIGVSRQDAKALIQEHSDVPHIVLNGHVYYPKSKLIEWVNRIGE